MSYSLVGVITLFSRQVRLIIVKRQSVENIALSVMKINDLKKGRGVLAVRNIPHLYSAR